MDSKYKLIEVSELDNILTSLTMATEIDLENFDLLVYCGGGQSKKFYRELASDSQLEILWTGWGGPAWAAILSFIPGQAGLIRLLKQGRLKTLFEELAVSSVSYLCYVPKGLTTIIKTDIERSAYSHNPLKILGNQNEFLFIQAEMDDTVIRKSKEFYVFDYEIGVNAHPKIRNLFGTFAH